MLDIHIGGNIIFFSRNINILDNSKKFLLLYKHILKHSKYIKKTILYHVNLFLSTSVIIIFLYFTPYAWMGEKSLRKVS